MDAVGDGKAQVMAKPRCQSRRPRRRSHRLRRRRARQGRGRLAEHSEQGARCRGLFRGEDRFFRRGGSRLLVLDVPPRMAFRRRAAAAARALRVPVWQSDLESEIRAQEVRKVGAVGTNEEAHLVFAETQMVEQEVARPIAQHDMQGRPRRRRVERRVEQLLDPCGIQVFRRAIPGVAHGPDAPLRSAWPRRLGGAHGDVARDGAALGRGVVARERRAPGPRRRRGDLGDPDIGRPAAPLTRLGRDASVGRDQRKLALERLLRGEDDAQRRALPRRCRRGQDRELGCVFAGAQWTFGPGVRDREEESEKRACDQRQGCHRRSRLACWKQSSPLAPKALPNNTAKALAKSWRNPLPAEFACGHGLQGR